VPLGSGRIDSIMRHGVNPLSNANAAILKCGIPVAFRLFNIAHCPKKTPPERGLLRSKRQGIRLHGRHSAGETARGLIELAGCKS
jgi:hypothetical protein